MLTYEKARKIGIHACMEKLGRSFVEARRETACSGYGDRSDHVFCFVGVDDRPIPEMGENLILDLNSEFPYMACCNVRYSDGHVDFLKCSLPE